MQIGARERDEDEDDDDNIIINKDKIKDRQS